MPDGAVPGPLHGLRVVEAATLAAGPMVGTALDTLLIAERRSRQRPPAAVDADLLARDEAGVVGAETLPAGDPIVRVRPR